MCRSADVAPVACVIRLLSASREAVPRSSDGSEKRISGPFFVPSSWASVKHLPGVKGFSPRGITKEQGRVNQTLLTTGVSSQREIQRAPSRSRKGEFDAGWRRRANFTRKCGRPHLAGTSREMGVPLLSVCLSPPVGVPLERTSPSVACASLSASLRTEALSWREGIQSPGRADLRSLSRSFLACASS